MIKPPPSPDRTKYTDGLFRELYKAEFEHKNKHDSVDSFLLAATTVLGGIAVYYSKLLPSAAGIWGGCFMLLFTVYGAAFVGALISLSGSVWPREQGYTSDPRDLYNYAEGLRAHFNFSEKDEDKLEAATEDELRRTLRPMYVDAASQNRFINKQKLRWQTNTKKCLIFAVYAFVFNAVPTYFVQRNHVDVTNFRVIPSENSNAHGSTSSAEPTEAPAANVGPAVLPAAKAGAAEGSLPTRGPSPATPAPESRLVP